MNADEIEVQKLKDLVKDLELQNTALKNNSQEEASDLRSSHPARRSFSSEGEDDFLDLSLMDTLDDDASWLFSASPHNHQSSPSPCSAKNPAIFETPELLPWRRALSHKLHNIEKGVAPSPPSLFPMRCSPMQSPVKSLAGTPSSLNSSYTSDESLQSPRGAGEQPQQVLKYMESVLGYAGVSNSESAVKSALADTCVSGTATTSGITSQSAHSSDISNEPTYSSSTFTRPKKKKRVPAVDVANSDSSSNSESVSVSAFANGSNQPSSAADEMGAGDSTTYVLNRGKTRTIESSEVLEAQRLITSSPQSLTGDEDSLGMLPADRTFKRRNAASSREDKSKRESLDIQTLARLQEQSLRDSLSAVRKASSSSAGSNGVPGLNISDLDSSNGSLSSINDDIHEQAERKAMQGSGTFRIKKSPRQNGSPSPTVELNGDTPIIHKSVVNSRSSKAGPEANKQKPQIRSSLSPRTIQAPKVSGLRKPNSSLPTPARTRSRTGGVPTPTSRSGLKPPANKSYSSR